MISRNDGYIPFRVDDLDVSLLTARKMEEVVTKTDYVAVFKYSNNLQSGISLSCRSWENDDEHACTVFDIVLCLKRNYKRNENLTRLRDIVKKGNENLNRVMRQNNFIKYISEYIYDNFDMITHEEKLISHDILVYLSQDIRNIYDFDRRILDLSLNNYSIFRSFHLFLLLKSVFKTECVTIRNYDFVQDIFDDAQLIADIYDIDRNIVGFLDVKNVLKLFEMRPGSIVDITKDHKELCNNDAIIQFCFDGLLREDVFSLYSICNILIFNEKTSEKIIFKHICILKKFIDQNVPQAAFILSFTDSYDKACHALLKEWEERETSLSLKRIIAHRINQTKFI